MIRALSSTGLVAATILFAACSREAEAPPAPIPPVMVGTVTGMTLIDRIESTGELLAVDEAAVAAEVAGRVTETLVVEGVAVVTGDPILEIDREKKELEVKSARARVAEARQGITMADREAKRRRSLHSQKATSDAKLDQAETDLAAAQARLAGADANLGLAERALRDASVSAPFAGLIARRYVSAGDFVRAGDKLFDLVSLDPIEVEFHLTERDSGRVKIGDAVDVRVAPYPDDVFRGTVTVVSPRIDAKTRTLRVKAQIDNTDSRLRPGTFARADLGIAKRANVPMIPENAVLQRSDGAVVYRLVEDDRVERRNVRLGAFHEGLVEAVSGVELGDRVVVRGQSRLIDGSIVDVRRYDGSPDGPSLAQADEGNESAGVPQ